MKDTSVRDLQEATRLTKDGRLLEATTLLQSVLQRTLAARSADATIAPGAQASMPAGTLGKAVTPQPRAAHNGIAPATAASPRIAADVHVARAAVARPSRSGGEFLTSTFENAAGARTYKLYVPSGYCGEPLPLVVMLHGCSQSPDDFAAGTRMNVVAEAANCFVAYPAQPSSANVGKCWNWFKPGDQRRDAGEPSLIAGLTQAIATEYAVDAKRVYIAGLSAGGAAAAVVAAAYPDVYAALGVHSGIPCGLARDVSSAMAVMQSGSRRSGAVPAAAPAVAFPGAVPVSDVPTIVFHGDRDTTVHPSNADLLVAQSAHAGLQTSVRTGKAEGGLSYTQTSYRDASGRTLLENWVVHGAGHAWLGGSSAGSFTEARGPDASREMLRFFLEHAATS